MKKHYLGLLSVMLCALFCSNAFAERIAYGFVVDDNTGECSPYLCSIDLDIDYTNTRAKFMPTAIPE